MKFRDDLLEIVEGRISSDFHQAARDRYQNESKRVDALQQIHVGEYDMLPGYYGFKGSEALLHAALECAYSTISRVGKKERWILSMSPTGYASSVLVPELAVRLIMEDQSCDRVEAEKIRIESIEYGRLVYGET
ncbi:restriction of telomere capping protein 4 [Lipomyces oligophaga]|uniref:restriction of telomere capping protein 4 n=1 Tax=Lipomyces oligophaga TaxID=45792 RepID=UPI0034CF1CFB